MRKTLLTFALLAAGSLWQTVTAAKIGYTNGTCGKTNIFRTGSTTTQGMAIKLGPGKLAALKGCTISGIDAVFGSKQSTDGNARLFITTQPDSNTPLREQTVKIDSTATKWQPNKLAEPYTITGDEGALYIGYVVEMPRNTYYPLSADYSADTKDACFTYNDGKWTDTYGLGMGCVNIRAVIDDAPASTDILVKTFDLGGYYKAGTPYQYSGQLLNFGTETVTEFDIALTVGNAEPVVYEYKDTIDIAPGGTFDFTLPEHKAADWGDLPITVEVTSVNGKADTEPGDNSAATKVFFYPEEMERTLLLEEFTGQDCPNCPEGHRNINSFLASTGYDVIEVAHHAGYYPDIFTMEEDSYYTFFYGSSNNYAPAFMLNRTTVPLLGTVPVMNTGTNLMSAAADYVMSQQPYVSLKMASTYDADSREARVRIVAYVNNTLPEGVTTLNVMLVQDSIRAWQSNGGDQYNHTMVFRGTLTNNAWGLQLPDGLAIGDSVLWENTYTLPESIRSTYWTAEALAQKNWDESTVTIATDPANTYLVAYVGGYDLNNMSSNEIYNCTGVKLGESHAQGGATAISGPTTAERRGDIRITTSGRRIVVSGACDGYAVYNMAGRQLPADSELAQGVYIVKATAAGRTTATKVVVK